MSQSPFVVESFPKAYPIRWRSHGQRSKCVQTSPLRHRFGSAACPLRLASRLSGLAVVSSYWQIGSQCQLTQSISLKTPCWGPTRRILSEIDFSPIIKVPAKRISDPRTQRVDLLE